MCRSSAMSPALALELEPGRGEHLVGAAPLADVLEHRVQRDRRAERVEDRLGHHPQVPQVGPGLDAQLDLGGLAAAEQGAHELLGLRQVLGHHVLGEPLERQRPSVRGRPKMV